MNTFNPLFKDLSQNSPVYILIKGDDIKYIEGKIISIGLPRTEIDKSTSMSKTVIDVTYSVNNTNLTHSVTMGDYMFGTNIDNSVALVATTKDVILSEVKATIKTCEDFLNTVEETTQKKERHLKQCNDLICSLDKEFAHLQALEKRIDVLEENSKETNSLLKTIIEKLG